MTFDTYGNKENPCLLLLPGLGVSHEIFLPLPKWLESGLPSFEEADMIIEARKIYGAPFNTEGFGDIPSQMYSSGRMGVHSEYIGEIEHVWVRSRDGE